MTTVAGAKYTPSDCLCPAPASETLAPPNCRAANLDSLKLYAQSARLSWPDFLENLERLDATRGFPRSSSSSSAPSTESRD